MTPTSVIDAFDRVCESLSLPRSSHIQLQQVIAALRARVKVEEEKENLPDNHNGPVKE